MVQKASTPWSARTVAEGGTDSPVGDLVPIPDKITPVVNTGFISLAGKYRGIPSDDLKFTFQDPDQALAAGADMEFNINMLQHDKVIIAVVDTSGNTINVDLVWKNPTTLTGPYTPFNELGSNGSKTWQSNRYLYNQLESFGSILDDSSDVLAATWQFYKVIGLQGTLGRLLIHNNEGSNAGTISTAYLRLV